MSLTTKILKFEEGYRATPYVDTEGYPTVGIGTKIGPKGAPIEQYTFTVGEKAAEALLEQELESIIWQLPINVNKTTNEYRKSILYSMTYQLGVSGVLKFKNMWMAIEAEDWDEAAKEALDSKWARQTPSRAKRHAEVLRTGNTIIYDGLI